jgi:hypothetical protein
LGFQNDPDATTNPALADRISNPSSENPQDHHCGSEVRTLDFQLKVHRIIVATILP